MQHKKLTDYPRPSVAVDVAVLTIRDDVLQVLVVEHRLGGLALPGTFLREKEVLAGAAARALREKAGLSDVAFTQLHVFDALDRDERGWVLSVGHSAALAANRIPADALLIPIVDGAPENGCFSITTALPGWRSRPCSRTTGEYSTRRT